MSEHQLMGKIRRDVDTCIEVWTEVLLGRFQENIEYLYAKGSSIKPWEGIIDYVPTLSDVDIHIKTVDGFRLFQGNSDGFRQSLEITEEYEEKFKKENPEHMHIPRTQIVKVNRFIDDPDFINPASSDNVKILYGNPEFTPLDDNSRIRSVDMKNLMDLEKTLDTLPLNTVDRVGLDLWQLIRRLCWLVSPTPVRLLTQLEDHPEEVWSWNRTKVCRKLVDHNFNDLAEEYSQYYLAGWEMFQTRFQDSNAMRKVLYRAYNVLEKTYQYAQKIM